MLEHGFLNAKNLLQISSINQAELITSNQAIKSINVGTFTVLSILHLSDTSNMRHRDGLTRLSIITSLLSDKALDLILQGEIEITPEYYEPQQFTHIYKKLNEILDSRQSNDTDPTYESVAIALESLNTTELRSLPEPLAGRDNFTNNNVQEALLTSLTSATTTTLSAATLLAPMQSSTSGQVLEASTQTTATDLDEGEATNDDTSAASDSDATLLTTTGQFSPTTATTTRTTPMADKDDQQAGDNNHLERSPCG